MMRNCLKPLHILFSLPSKKKSPLFKFPSPHVLFSAVANPDSKDCSRKEQFFLALFEKCCSKSDVERVHAHVIQTGFGQNLFVVGKIIVFCAVSELGSMDYAVSVFEKIENPDGFLWNTMIRGFVRINDVEKVFSYYKRMIECGDHLADNFTFSFLLKFSGQLGSIMLGKQLHCDTIKHGLDFHVFVRNNLIHMYGIVKYIDIARQLFDEIPSPDLVAWNIIIDCHVYCGEFTYAVELFYRMQRGGIEPDKATLVVILSACSALGNLELGRQVHSYVDHAHMRIDLQFSNSLIDMYSKCGEVGEAYEIFSRMNARNVVSWNTMILGLATHSREHRALELCSRMMNEKLMPPDDVTFLGALMACSHGGMVEEGRKYFDCMVKEYHIQPTIKHCGCMVDILSRAGFLEEAYEFIRSMPMQCNAIVWRMLLAACRVHGQVELGELVRMHVLELEPDHTSNYVLPANMYASIGEWNSVSSVRESLKDRGVQKPSPGNSFISIRPRIRLHLESVEAQ